MFEVRSHIIGDYRKTFIDYNEALAHAEEKSREGGSYVVFELIMRKIVRVA